MKSALCIFLLLVCARYSFYSFSSNQDATTPVPKDSPQEPRKATEEQREGLFYLWNVQTKNTVRDNFGHYIAERYYVVELLINNQLKRKVIITGIGFNTKQDGETISFAATDPQTIKGVLLKKDLIGRNARFKNVVKAFGLMLTGASGFFKAAGSAATYNRSINIFNDPFQKGLDLVSPDTIKAYLETLNQDIFRTGLVLPEGSIGYLRVFVDKNNVFPPSKLKTMLPHQRKELYDPTEPLAVQRILNEVVLQGQKIRDSESTTFRMGPPE